MTAVVIRAADEQCAQRGCKRLPHTRGYCESCYRRRIRMRLHGYRDATTAREHIKKLRDLGWTWEGIAQAAGLSTYVAHRLHIGTTRRLLPESEQAILSLPLHPYDSHRGINSTGTRRRVQALAWMGWPCREIADRAGTTQPTLATLLLPHRRISFALARRVAAVYEELCMTPGPSKQSASKARKLGFAPPMAWDDNRIDDPKARPLGVRLRQAS